MPDSKVLILFPSLENKGGVVSFCQLLTENLASSFNIDHLAIGNRPQNKSWFKRAFYFIHDSWELRKRLKNNRYDLLHLNPSLKIFSLLRDSFYLAMVNRLHSGKTVVMFHGWDGHLAEKIIRNPFAGRLFRRIYKKACLILVLCRPFKEQLAGMGLPPEIVKVVTTMYEGNQLPASLRDKKTGETTKILFMARLIKPKGVYLAAEVGRLLVENGYKNIKLFFAGDGPELEGLRKYIKDYSLDDYLEAPGYISGRRKEDLLAESDIFLFPTTSEGCPVVVLEAMGAGLAIISTPVGAIPEIIKHEENGFLIAGQDPKAFYEAVKKLIEDKVLLKRIQNLNKEKADGLYEEKVVTKKFEELYLSLIGGKESCAKTTSC